MPLLGASSGTVLVQAPAPQGLAREELASSSSMVDDDLEEGLAQLRSVFSATCGLVISACSSMSLLSPSGLASEFALAREAHADGHMLSPLEALAGCKRAVRRRALANLPQFVADDADAGAECAICTEPFEAGETELMRLPCAHTYCKPCITRWLEQSHTCPTCRWEFEAAQTRIKRPSQPGGGLLS